MSETVAESRKKARAPRVPAIRKSLAFLLLSLQGTSVVIELKNDTEISGIVEGVDAAMNVSLTEARHSLHDSTILEMESTTVKGPSIRYVHIPSKVRMRTQVTDYVKKLDRIRGQNRPSIIKDRPKLTAAPENKEDIVLS